MRQLMERLRGVRPTANSAQSLRTADRPVVWVAAGLLAVAGSIAFPALAKDEAATKESANAKEAADKDPATAEARSTLPLTRKAAIPECFERLTLSAEQNENIGEIVRSYDESSGAVWKQFGDRYMQAIVMESSLLAAIEDTLSEPQRQQVRDQRHKTARYEKSIAATSTKPNQATLAPNESTTKPATATEEGLAAVEISLTSDQEAMADKIQERYRSQLRSLNRDIQGMHTRLVSLEADKLVEMEKMLTKDQLASLRANRQKAPEAPKLVGRKFEQGAE